MKPGNAGTVLLYNCPSAKFSKLQHIFAMLHLRMRMIGPDRYHLPLSDLASGTGEPGPAEEPIPESMLVFCGLNPALLNQVLEIIRLAKLPPIPLKAVLTEANRSWNTLQLRQELLQEQKAIADGERAHPST